MVNIETVTALKKAGFEMPQIKAAVQQAEETGSANIGGYVVRFRQDDGKMIVLHPSWNGIYMGDYNAHLIFEKELSYSFGHYCFIKAKHRQLETVLATLTEHKTNGYILCECDANRFPLRKRQVEKLGYTVYKSNIEACQHDWSTCYFLIA